MLDQKKHSLGVLWRWVWRNLAGVRLPILGSCIMGIIRVGLSLLFVWISKMLVDAAVSRQAEVDYLITLSIVLIALMAAETGLGLSVQYITTHTEIKFKNRLRLALFDQVLISRWIERQNIHSGDMISRLSEDVRQFTDVACSRLQQVVVMIFQFGGAFAIFCVLSWKLALCVVGIMPLCVVLGKIYVRKTRRLTAEIRRAESEINVGMQEGIQHHILVQTLEARASVSSRVENSQSGLYQTWQQRLRFSLFSRGLVHVGFVACFLTAFLWSVWHLHTGVITFGTMTAFLQLVSRLQNPVVNISHQIPAMVQSITSIDRLIEIEDLPVEEQGAPQMLTSPVGVRLDNVSFRYPGKDEDVFVNFSYDFAPGSKTVIMGETGVGKSTLVKLMLGLITPKSGSINLYHHNEQIKASARTRCNMTYVPQGDSLLDGTIRDNLLLANPQATDEDIHQALHTAVADFVYDLPDGLNSRCGELGTHLSGGQAQRIAIARALLRPGGILLLDEFNSSLDQTTAQTLMQRLMSVRSDDTIIFISHRPEVLEHCALLKLSKDVL